VRRALALRGLEEASAAAEDAEDGEDGEEVGDAEDAAAFAPFAASLPMVFSNASMLISGANSPSADIVDSTLRRSSFGALWTWAGSFGPLILPPLPE